jgi:hypothetical protein
VGINRIAAVVAADGIRKAEENRLGQARELGTVKLFNKMRIL